jgi:predicted metal-dependent HD superfamily phosphohydrolase
MNIERWLELMAALNFADNRATHQKLVDAYSEKHRHYHSAAHIEDCLQKFDMVKQSARESENIALAIWFHDAVYAPLKPNNELQSANWATQFLMAQCANTDQIKSVRELIMVTCHQAEPVTNDEALLIDIDLSILGANPATYELFETNVRKEYRWVPWFLYRAKRSEILASFLNRDRLYSCDLFHQRYDAPARANLVKAIADLRNVKK